MIVRKIRPNGPGKIVAVPTASGFEIGDYVRIDFEKGKMILSKVLEND